MKNRVGANTGLWLFFFIWPFGAFLLSIRHILNKHYQKVIIAFAFLFGYSVFMYGGDIERYAEMYRIIDGYTWTDFFYILFNPLEQTAQTFYAGVNKPDRYAFTLMFLFSRITDDPRLMFSFISIVFTALYLAYVNEILENTIWLSRNLTQKIFFAFLLVIIPFYVGVTGIRFWTALFVFMIFLMRYIKTNNKKYILYSAASMFFHYSFFVPFLITLFYAFAGYNKKIVYSLLFIGMVVFFSSSIGQKLTFLQNLAAPFQESVVYQSAESYTNIELLEERFERTSETNWYVSLRSDSILYFLIIISFLEIFGFLKFNENQLTKRMFPLIVIFLIYTLLTIDLGSLGRFKNIFYLLALGRYVILVGLQPFNMKLKVASRVLIPILLLWVLVVGRGGFYFVDPLLLVANPIILFFEQSSISLSQLLVGH